MKHSLVAQMRLHMRPRPLDPYLREVAFETPHLACTHLCMRWKSASSIFHCETSPRDSWCRNRSVLMDKIQEGPQLTHLQAPVARDTTTQGLAQKDRGEKDQEWLKQYSCVYFGYASNLSPRTMKQRCPDSLFVSLARITGWRWIINETGYANIIPGSPDDEVWGSLCFLSRRDEMALDESEGVPWLYEKMKLKVERVPQEIAGAEWRAQDAGEEIEATAYVDIQRLTEGKIEKEYVTWVRKAIEDAKLCGMPDSYAEKYIRKFLPERSENDLPDQEIMMVRTLQFGEKDAGLVPRGFASWSRG